ncbi:MAG: sigma-54-dependent Fis family transcriptional regulator [Gammaproteobacteria bacterium]|nr:sigma-54-dependent Fis family transcriptional regulator [Gammaproteobacteria bacterium]
MSQATILVVEDDPTLREALSDTLTLSNYKVLLADNGETALSLLSKHPVQLVISDVQMQPMDGHSLLQKIKNSDAELPVVLITAYGTIQKAVEAMQQGAADYLVKPFEAHVLVDMVSKLARTKQQDENLIAVDPRSKELLNLATRVAATEATVMISGESGSGKEVIARHIHSSSPRAKGPFIAINCAAIPENMLEAVLFGYEKGAFTGAYQTTPGKFEQAQGGTLLLDEISEMDLALQAKLLRVLQEREVERLGGRKIIPLDVRVLATTNRNLKQQVDENKFREDLYYRLNVFPLRLLPLRQRPADIIPLACKILKQRNGSEKGGKIILTDAAKTLLSGHQWPGNVRELDNVMQRALIFMHGNEITTEALHFEAEACMMDRPATTELLSSVEEEKNNLGSDLKLREQRLILDALQAGQGSRKYAAEKLGISPRTLRYKLARLREQGVALPC